MAKKYFYKVYYRTAGAIVTTLNKSGTYPDYTFSGWTVMPGLTAEAAKMSPEADGDEPLGDGTILTTGEKIGLEVKLLGFTGANYSTVRSALINNRVDLLLVDPDQLSPAYAAFGVRLFPKLVIEGGAEPAMILSGERKYGAAPTTPPFQIVSVA